MLMTRVEFLRRHGSKNDWVMRRNILLGNIKLHLSGTILLIDEDEALQAIKDNPLQKHRSAPKLRSPDLFQTAAE